MKISTYLSVAALTLFGFTAAAAGQMPQVEKPVKGKDVILSKMSDNGKWAVAQTTDPDNPLLSTAGTLYDLETFTPTTITHESGFVGLTDVSNDGNIIVGSCNGKPAYWTKSTKSWTILQIPEVTFTYTLMAPAKADGGGLNAVTPDGRYAVGYLTCSQSDLLAAAVAYDLQSGESIDLTGLPTLDQSHLDQQMNNFFDISPDGRYIVGMLSQAYMLDSEVDGGIAPLCTYVYDRETKTYDMIGFTDYADKKWTPEVDGLFFIESPSMSNNGEWITGSAYIVHEIAGVTDYANEATYPFRYNVRSKELTVYTDTEDADIAGFAIDNNGVVYGATPASNPYPNCVVRSGNYFIGLDEIFKQVYGYDFYEESGFAVTGKPLSISDDCKTVIMLPDTSGTYVLRMPDSLAEAASKVKLLGTYSISPNEGVKVSRLNKFTVTFDRNLQLKGESEDIVFAATDGSEEFKPMATGLGVEGKKLNITFRPKDLSEGKEYKLTIPAGTVVMKGNDQEANEEIVVTYIGRANLPVEASSIAPRPDSPVTTLNMTTDPIVIRFNSEIKLKEGAMAYLYRNDDTNPMCELNVAVQGNQAFLFPSAGQYLYSGSEYHVLVPEGTVTDLSGGGANKEISFSYEGAYIRKFDMEDNYVFNDDCSTYANFMYYDGDRATPTAAMQEWGFTSDNPWIIVRDDNSTDMAMASHSMYTPSTQSDDWMCTTQLMIPDDKCYLEFDAQNFSARAKDILDVYVYACEAVYNTMTKDFVNDILTKGELVFHEQLNPGKSEQTIDNDWTNYRVQLDKYAKKEVYIAFVNRNKDQSAIFIDNVRVVHDQPYSTVFETPATVVNLKSTPIKGYMLFASELDTYKSVKLTLSDSKGKVIDTYERTGLSLKKGDQFDFKFDKELPLESGEVNTFYVEVSLNNNSPAKITGKISNLLFEPKRRIVLEEYTGSECPNCPKGIRAMENIESLYPGVLIPITIRTYQNDKLGLGMGEYSIQLGLDAMGAPSAFIDRKEYAYPMIEVEGDYRFTGTGIPTAADPNKDERLWLDVFRTEYETPADLGMYFSTSLSSDKKSVDVKVHVQPALNQPRAAYKVFAVITEDHLVTYQKNNVYTIEDPDLGEWGKGGKYGSMIVSPVEAEGVARQTWGTTYLGGTAGLFPSSMHAGWGYDAEFRVSLPDNITDLNNCNMVVMILDETNRVVNASTCELVNGQSDMTGIDSIVADDFSEAAIGMAVINGSLCINADGAYNVNAYDLSGATILSARGEGLTALPLYGYQGVLIVKATDARGLSKSAKFFVR